MFVRVRPILLTAAFVLAVSPFVRAAQPPKEGLILWLDASDVNAEGKVSNLENGAPVARWVDKSGHGNHVEQDTAERRPTLQSGVIAGRSVVRFHGDDLLDRSDFGRIGTGDQPFHILAVMKAGGESSHGAQRLVDLNSRDQGTDAFPQRTGFWVGHQQSRKKVRLGVHHGDEGEGLSVAWNGRPQLHGSKTLRGSDADARPTA